MSRLTLPALAVLSMAACHHRSAAILPRPDLSGYSDPGIMAPPNSGSVISSAPAYVLSGPGDTGITSAYTGTIGTTPEVWGTLENGICSVCKKAGQKSTVTPYGMSSCTLAGCLGGHYDEDGKWVPPVPCNTCRTEMRCSNGHRILHAWKQ